MNTHKMVDVEKLLYAVHPLAIFTRKLIDREVEDKKYLPLTCVFHSVLMKELLSKLFPKSEVKLVSGFAGWLVSPYSLFERKEFFNCIPDVGSFFYEESDIYTNLIEREEKAILESFEFDKIRAMAHKLVDNYREIEIKSRFEGDRSENLTDMVKKYKETFFDPLVQDRQKKMH